ncbi:putative phospholipid-transporting ATPase 9 [Vitis vinifera]|uniref:Putative phospholipid-transporting ATPase 9 n=1 Tax=Vitis vinifera TaxID=29760 RepID=A0A438ECY7_VITVI|nr:putative phospholipid-transporting ATPase 9 [Vitis vinifera]
MAVSSTVPRRSAECSFQLASNTQLDVQWGIQCHHNLLFCIKALDSEAFNSGGKTVGREILGTTMYTCVVWVVNCQMALTISYFTLIQHIFIWGSIALWYLFLLVFGIMSPSISSTAYKLFIEALAPAPTFWIVTLFVVISTLIPFYAYTAIQMRFFPMYHGMIQWLRHEGKQMIQNTATWCDRGPCGHRLLVYQHVEWLELIDKQKNDSHR